MWNLNMSSLILVRFIFFLTLFLGHFTDMVLGLWFHTTTDAIVFLWIFLVVMLTRSVNGICTKRWCHIYSKYWWNLKLMTAWPKRETTECMSNEPWTNEPWRSWTLCGAMVNSTMNVWCYDNLWISWSDNVFGPFSCVNFLRAQLSVFELLSNAACLVWGQRKKIQDHEIVQISRKHWRLWWKAHLCWNC